MIRKEYIMNELENSLNKLMDEIKESFLRWNELYYGRYGDQETQEFNESLKFTIGKKYAKIVTGSSVWGFVCLDNDMKFRKGDILLAAGWSTPARNKARGNCLENDFRMVSWTGPMYL
jgi:hypothetical protein